MRHHVCTGNVDVPCHIIGLSHAQITFSDLQIKIGAYHRKFSNGVRDYTYQRCLAGRLAVRTSNHDHQLKRTSPSKCPRAATLCDIWQRKAYGRHLFRGARDRVIICHIQLDWGYSAGTARKFVLETRDCILCFLQRATGEEHVIGFFRLVKRFYCLVPYAWETSCQYLRCASPVQNSQMCPKLISVISGWTTSLPV